MNIPVIGSVYTRLRSLWQRWFLWVLLAVLVVALLGTVVWLAGRHEAGQVQSALDRDTADAVADLRNGLLRNAHLLQALQTGDLGGGRWAAEAAALLRSHRELLRVERLDARMQPLDSVETPYRSAAFNDVVRSADLPDVALACASARLLGGGAYSPSHYLPLTERGTGTLVAGIEVMEFCLPMEPPAGTGKAAINGSPQGYLIASYGLRETLFAMVGSVLTRGQEVALTEVDGSRLVSIGTARRIGNRIFTSQQPLELPGATLVLRVDGWRAAPDLFPNMLTALVTAISIALVSVLVLLARDTRRRLRAERELADALAFRQAMEDSLITGLRARDLQGRITYVNPAFCEMVGFTAEELGHGAVDAPGGHEKHDLTAHPPGPDTPEAPNAPYWPTGLAHEYRQRQHVRLSGGVPPREGFESVFMRKDGSRFPVLIFEAPLINAQHVQTGWMSAFVDLSEQRRVEELSRTSQERLQASARLATVGEMASLMSHELTQPLAAIASYASGSLNLLTAAPVAGVTGLQATLADHADLTLAMRRIAEQADRAGQIIRSVHDFVRRRDRTREAVAPQALLDAVLPLVRLQARKLGVQVRVTVEADTGLLATPSLAMPDVWCDRTLVEQVLLNLARNGMQAMDQPEFTTRLLALRVTRAGLRHGAADNAVEASGKSGGQTTQHWLEFSVSDCGCGISDEVAGKLFTPFFTTRSDGMGLGLSLCRTVVEQHGGTLLHEPNQPCGTVFRFTLPVALPLAPTEST